MARFRRKLARQQAVLALVEQRRITSQQEIVDGLLEQGINATQASVSRDVRELGLVKLNDRYLPMDGLATAVLREQTDPLYGLITSTEPVGANLVVVRTAVGAANAVAVTLDRLGFKDVIGTIAGDDTIFVAVRSRSGQGRVLSRLRSWVARP